MRGGTHTRKFDPYVPRILLDRLVTAPAEPVLREEGTIVFIDLSGFTRLSERLSRMGKEGAEHVVETINSCFTVLLSDAYQMGGSLLKFGGDALLLWFEGEGHPLRGCASAVAMRRTLRQIGRIRTGGGQVVLRMSVGIHSATYETFLVGGSHREYLIAGPAVSKVVELEATASAGQILVSDSTARLLPERSVGAPCGPGLLLSRAPQPSSWMPERSDELPADDAVADCLSIAVREHLRNAPAAPEHRPATVAFLQYGDLDQRIATAGPEAAADALNELVGAAQQAADRYGICFLNSDIAADGGKLLFSAGAPRAVGDDEERMLLAMRQIVDCETTLPVRVGVNRGHTFTGEVGPEYRRTYVVMGDVVNLAARLSAKARWGTVLTTEGALQRSRTRFATTSLPPFTVKGKRRPIEAFEVENALRTAAVAPRAERLPLFGREREVEILKRSIDRARGGRGGLIELVGETGSGKSRLLAEARQLAHGMRFMHATCETYTQMIPYFSWREPLRQLLGLSSEDPDSLALDRLQANLEMFAPELLPWQPLIAIALGVEMPLTREVEELSPDFRTGKLHEVVLRFLAPALATPTLVEIEHAHLMDEASAALLHALCETLTPSSWLIIATRRDVKGGLVAPPESTIHIDLGLLSREDALALAEATPEAELLPPDIIDEAVERAGGSPEFLLDLLAAAASGSGELPGSIEAAASARLDALLPGDRAMVRRAAVLGLSFHAKRLEHVLPNDAPRPDVATWQRLQSVFAQDPDGHIRFKRPALREVAYETLPFRLRRELHAALATALEPLLGVDVDADPAVLSLHFTLAGDYHRAWRYAKAAAERAVAKFAQADAVRLYRRAIEAGRQDRASDRELAECWEALGEALTKTGHSAAAADALTAARNLVKNDPLAQARLFLRHIRIAHRQAQLTPAARWAGRGLRALGQADDEDSRAIRARLLAELGFVRYLQGRLREAENLCRTAIGQFAADVEERPVAHASYVLDAVLIDLGRLDEAVHAPRALAIYERLGDREEQGHVLNAMAARAHYSWHWDEAVKLYARAGEAYERGGSQTGIAIAACNIGGILSDRGLLEQAVQHLRRARRIWTANGERETAAYATVLLGRAVGRDGDIEQARRLLTAAATELRELGEARDLEEAEIAMAEAEALGGDASRAAELAEAHLSSQRELAWVKRIRAIALARLGQLDEAIDELENALSIARERDSVYDVAATLDVLQMLGAASQTALAERDSMLSRLGIERLPAVLDLVPFGREPVAAP
jgi:class 3 adenylate cyclase/tetratricopeptide (TPR) repeat protein